MPRVVSVARTATAAQRSVRPLISRRRPLLAALTTLISATSGRRRDACAAAMRMPEGAAAKVLADATFPEDFPFTAEDFRRFDESDDAYFYSAPRFVTHIDDGAIKALTSFYAKELPREPGVKLLDMCSSWISHLPDGYADNKEIIGLGMNEEELKKNPVLSNYVVQNLNKDPILPFEDNTFDVITNVVSVDYLSRPLEIFNEMRRVLKPNGRAIMSFSNRCFPTKAISLWTATDDATHIYIVGSYFHYTGFNQPKAHDISPRPVLFGIGGDPMYVVEATKA